MGLYQAVPSLNAEIAAWKRGYRHIAGVDEAGCGPLAGPVVAAAAILEPQFASTWWCEFRDSKMLLAPERERLAALIRAECAWGIGIASHEFLDEHGLTAAPEVRDARRRAKPCRAPGPAADRRRRAPEYRHRAIIHGDALVASIAAGSIIAKVARDAMMSDFHPVYPHYGFDTNRGYSTPEHKRALDEHGPCDIHRRLFAPVRASLEARGITVRVRGLAVEPEPQPANA